MVVEKRPEELAEVRRQGEAALHNPLGAPDAPSLRGVTEVLHVRYLTSFHDGRSWTIYKVRTGTFRVRRIRWDQVADLERMTQPLVGARLGFSTRPTLEAADVDIDSETVETWLVALGRVTIPAVAPSKHFQVDGARWGLRTMDGGFFMEWGIEPEEWRPLVTLAKEIGDRLDALFPNPG